MAETKKRRQLKTFPGLSAERFQHPQDQAATEALAGIPGLDLLVSKVMEYGLEQVYYLENIADNVRVTPRMLPRLHRYLGWGCRILDIEEPELYVTLDPTPNAFTYGHKSPFIVLTSGLIDSAGRRGAVVRRRARAGPHQGRARALHGAGAQHREHHLGARPGDAGHRIAARPGAGGRAARLVPQVRADRRPRRAAVRPEPRPVPEVVHEAGGRRQPAVAGDGSGGVRPPDPGLRGRRPVDAEPRLQNVSHGVAHAPVSDLARQGTRCMVTATVIAE